PILRMFGLLRFPDFTKPFITRLALANLSHLRVQIFESLSFCIRWDFNSALLRNERDLIVGVLVCRSIKHRTDSLADCHVVRPPVGIEQDSVAVFVAAI